jgi:hypothetical protein
MTPLVVSSVLFDTFEASGGDNVVVVVDVVLATGEN